MTTLQAALTPTLHPWEQQPGEPDRAYGWFCVYRSMGPARSLRSAHDLARRMANPLGRATAGNGAVTTRQQYLPGSWARYSTAWNWPGRARAYDRHVFARGLEDAVHAFGSALRALALNLERVAQGIGPTNYGELLDGLKLLGGQIAPQVCDAPQAAQADDAREHTHRIISDPQAAELACRLFERVAAVDSEGG